MKTPVEQAKDLLVEVENNPEALLFLISGAISRLNDLEEKSLGEVFKEPWYTQAISVAIN